MRRKRPKINKTRTKTTTKAKTREGDNIYPWEYRWSGITVMKADPPCLRSQRGGIIISDDQMRQQMNHDRTSWEYIYLGCLFCILYFFRFFFLIFWFLYFFWINWSNTFSTGTVGSTECSAERRGGDRAVRPVRPVGSQRRANGVRDSICVGKAGVSECYMHLPQTTRRTRRIALIRGITPLDITLEWLVDYFWHPTVRLDGPSVVHASIGGWREIFTSSNWNGYVCLFCCCCLI